MASGQPEGRKERNRTFNVELAGNYRVRGGSGGGRHRHPTLAKSTTIGGCGMRRLILTLFLLSAAALAQSFPPPSVTWFNLPITAAWGNSAQTNSFTKPTSGEVYPSGALVVTMQGVAGATAASNCSILLSFGGTVTGGALTVVSHSRTPVTILNAPIPTAGNISSLVIANGSNFYRVGFVNPFSSPQQNANVISSPFISVTPSFSCTTYATAGTMNIEFVPDITPVYSYAELSFGAATPPTSPFTLKTAAGELYSVNVTVPMAGQTIAFFDAASCVNATGEPEIANVSTATLTTYIFHANFVNGLCMIFGTGLTAGSIEVSFR
jgi:hypothetical protein